MGDLDFASLIDYVPALLRGLGVTCQIAVLALLFGMTFGLVVAIARSARFRVLQVLSGAYVELFRSTPLLAQLLWVYFVLPALIGIDLTGFEAGVLTLGMNTAAYTAEIYRSGIQSIPVGQRDAAFVLGLSRITVFRRIVLPQAVRIVLPPLTANVMLVMKGTAYLSIISVSELTYVGGLVSSETFRFLEVFLVIALIYFVLIYPVGRLAGRLERRLVLPA